MLNGSSSVTFELHTLLSKLTENFLLKIEKGSMKLSITYFVPLD